MACASAANYQPACVCLCHAGAAETRSTVPAMLAVLPEWLCTERPSTHDDCGWCRLPTHAYAEVHELYSPWMSLFLPWRTVLTLDSGGCVGVCCCAMAAPGSAVAAAAGRKLLLLLYALPGAAQPHTVGMTWVVSFLAAGCEGARRAMRPCCIWCAPTSTALSLFTPYSKSKHYEMDA